MTETHFAVFAAWAEECGSSPWGGWGKQGAKGTFLDLSVSEDPILSMAGWQEDLPCRGSVRNAAWPNHG